MKDDISEKLSGLLESPINKECEVVYLMVEIRKIIDHKRKELEEEMKRKYYPTLSFYADWCVHIEMDRKTAQFHLKHIESLVNQSNGINNKIFDFLRFEEFKP